MAIAGTELRIQVSCPNCRLVNAASANYCADCGAALRAEADGVPADRDDAVNSSGPEAADGDTGRADGPIPLRRAKGTKILELPEGMTLDGGRRPGSAPDSRRTATDDTKDGDPPANPDDVRLWQFTNASDDESTVRTAFGGNSAKLLSEKQDAIMAKQCYDRTSRLLSENEEIEYIATARPDAADRVPVCAVATNKRIVFYSTLHNGYIDLDSPDACLWENVDEMELEEDPDIRLILLAVDGWRVELRGLAVQQARKLYVYGVDHSERVLRNRVESHMASRAGSIYVSEPLTASQVADSPPAQPAADQTAAPLEASKTAQEVGVASDAEEMTASLPVTETLAPGDGAPMSGPLSTGEPLKADPPPVPTPPLPQERYNSSVQPPAALGSPAEDRRQNYGRRWNDDQSIAAGNRPKAPEAGMTQHSQIDGTQVGRQGRGSSDESILARAMRSVQPFENSTARLTSSRLPNPESVAASGDAAGRARAASSDLQLPSSGTLSADAGSAAPASGGPNSGRLSGPLTQAMISHFSGPLTPSMVDQPSEPLAQAMLRQLSGPLTQAMIGQPSGPLMPSMIGQPSGQLTTTHLPTAVPTQAAAQAAYFGALATGTLRAPQDGSFAGPSQGYPPQQAMPLYQQQQMPVPPQVQYLQTGQLLQVVPQFQEYGQAQYMQGQYVQGQPGPAFQQAPPPGYAGQYPPQVAQAQAFQVQPQVQPQPVLPPTNYSQAAPPPQQGTPRSDEDEIVQRLTRLKRLVEAGLITKDEYDGKKKQLLDNL